MEYDYLGAQGILYFKRKTGGMQVRHGTWEENRFDLAELLYENNMVQFGQFRLALHEEDPSAPLSPYYINLRPLCSYPRGMQLVEKLFRRMVRSGSFDKVVGVPRAGEVLATSFSRHANASMLRLDLQKKSHGIPVDIIGGYEVGQKVLVIEDVITSGKSVLEAINILKSNTFRVPHVVAIVDREQGGVEAIRRTGPACTTIFTATRLLEIGVEMGVLSQDQYQTIKEYREKERSKS